MNHNRFKIYISTMLPAWIGCLVALILIGVEKMDIGYWVSIIIAIIAALATLISTLWQLKRDGKTIDIINNNTKNTENIFDITKNTDKLLIGEINPKLDTVERNTSEIGFLVDEVKYQKRIKEQISSDINDNKDILMQGLNSLYEKNALLNEKIKSLNYEKELLLLENNSLKKENKNLQQRLYSRERNLEKDFENDIDLEI